MTEVTIKIADQKTGHRIEVVSTFDMTGWSSEDTRESLRFMTTAMGRQAAEGLVKALCTS